MYTKIHQPTGAKLLGIKLVNVFMVRAALLRRAERGPAGGAGACDHH